MLGSRVIRESLERYNYSSKEQADALFRIGEYVADHGIEGGGSYIAARALLLRQAPQISGQPIRQQDEIPLDAALRIADHIDGGVLPIQGPPGTGKTYTGARIICRLVERGKKVGITANSHKVIRNLLDEVVEASIEMGIDLTCIQKPKELEPDQDRLVFARNNDGVLERRKWKREPMPILTNNDANSGRLAGSGTNVSSADAK